MNREKADQIYKKAKADWDSEIAASEEDPRNQEILREISDMILPRLRRNLDAITQAGEENIKNIRRG